MTDPIHMPLWQAADELYFSASCNDCKDGVREVDLYKMRDLVGENVPLSQAKDRLRCAACGSKSFTIVTLFKRASTAHTMKAHWKPPR